MKHFFIRLILFLSPMALAILLIVASAFYLGDAVPIPLMIQWQQQSERPIVYQPWVLRNLANYKFEVIQQTNPRLLIMGSSRVTSFRAGLANNDPSLFYNAGIPSTNIFDARSFLEYVIASGHAPDVIILGLDISNYNGDALITTTTAPPVDISLLDSARDVYASLRRVSRMWVTDTSDMVSYLQNRQLPDVTLTGLQVLTYKKGFLADGSRYVVDIETNVQSVRELEEVAFMQREGHFTPGETVNEMSLAQVRAILELAESNDITVIGILPPYHPDYYSMMTESGDFDYMLPAMDALQVLFSDYDMPFYNYTDPLSVGGSEAEMLDSFHFSDLLSLRIYHDLLTRHPDLLGEFSDEETLSTWLTEYQVYPLDFFTINLP